MDTVLNTGTAEPMVFDAIRDAILTAMGNFGPADMQRQAHKAAMEKARDASISVAEQAYSELAELAYRHRWSVSEAKKAAKKAAEIYAAGGNSAEAKAKRKSSADTFKSRLMLMLDEQVRPHVREYFRLCNAAWEAENAIIARDGDAAEKPIHDCWPRANHVALAAFRARSSDPKKHIEGFALHGIEDVTRFAIMTAANREFDFENAHARLMRIREDLQKFHNLLPTPVLQACLDAMAVVKVETLQEAAKTRLSTVRVAAEAAPEDEDEDEDEAAPEDEDEATPITTDVAWELIEAEPARASA